MRITAVKVSNFKRVRDVEVTPDADRLLVLIGGKNAQGKSSLLDALTVAFGGKRAAPADPVRHGAEEAVIDVELDGGDVTVHRVLDANGGKLEVRERGSVIRSPQARLDKLIGARFLDPIAFLQLAATEQRARLLEMFDRDGAIAKLEERRERIYAKRTEVGRDLKKAQGEIARLPPVVDVGEPIDVAALNNELRALTEKRRRSQDAEAALKAAESKRTYEHKALEATDREIADLENRLAALKTRRGVQVSDLELASQAEDKARAELAAAASEWSELEPRRAEIDHELARASAHNRAVFEAEANAKRLDAAAATVQQLEAQTAQQTELLDKIDAQKLDILASVGLPVEGLGISSDGLTLNGVPFAQASAAERLRVALALAMAASPGLDDIWIRDGALLDDDTLELIAEMAAKAGKRPWIERVGDRDPGAIVIHDGTNRDEVQRAAG